LCYFPTKEYGPFYSYKGKRVEEFFFRNYFLLNRGDDPNYGSISLCCLLEIFAKTFEMVE
jgi:hypothetical protein